MRLKSFHVRMFRNIVDSGVIPAESVTSLVGKNESGKSAILHALHHLNPAKPAVTLSILDEYPRWLKKEHEISGEIEKAVPILATFELSDAERSNFDAAFGKGVLESSEIVAKRTYVSETIELDFSLRYSKFIDPFLKTVSGPLKAELGAVETTSQLTQKLDELIAASDATDQTSVEIAAEATEAKSALVTRLGGHANLTSAVRKFMLDALPRTFYFSSYSQLRGRYRIEEVFAAIHAPSDEEEVQAAADFLKLARVVPTTIEDWDYETSNAELEAVSSLLTRRVKDHWKQNNDLKLAVKIEPQQDSDANGRPLIKRYLQFRVEDSRHDFSSRLDRRSTGFQWFVSFLASFLEFEADKNLILLLDEPGLSLHARAQMDLLDTIESKLAINRQVLYSTHSPFLVQTNRLNQVRIVEDQGHMLGSTVISDAGVVSDSDTLFPLQAALGYDIAQSLFIGNRNIIVEGISDFIYLTAISDHLESIGRASLPPDARLLPAGGATNIPTFLALLGGQLDVVVLIDGGASKQRIETSITRGRLDSAKVISLDGFAAAPKPDIEDLFTPSEYIALYNEAFNATLSVADIKGKDRMVARIGRHIGSEFNHGVVGASFLRNLDKSIKSLSAGTLDRFEAVILALAKALPPA